MQTTIKKVKQTIFQLLGHLLTASIVWLNRAAYFNYIGIYLAKFLDRMGLLIRYKSFFQKILDTNFSHRGAVSYFDFYFKYQRHLIRHPNFDTDINPLFIVGCMRSGTTIFAKTLDVNSDICWLEGELYDVWQYLAGAASGINGHHCKRLTAADVTEEASISILAYFRHAIYRKECKPQAYVLNKNPHLMNKISFVQRIFPNAKFLFIIRNIYPLSYSTLRMFTSQHYGLRKLHAFFPQNEAGNCWKFIPHANIRNREKNRIIPGYDGEINANFKLIPEAWIKLNYWALKDLITVNSDNKLLVIYENLIKSPEMMLKRVFDFLGFGEDEKALMQAVNYISQNRISFPSNNPLKEWENALSTAQKEIILSTVEEHRAKFNFIADTIADEVDISLNSDFSW